MNKLVLNQSARHHIRFFPMKDTITDLPETERERILWCKREYKKLRESPDAKREALYKSRAKGYMISVWSLSGRHYLIQSLRNEFGTFNDTVYVSRDLGDLLAIAAFLKDNVEQIMADYKDQIFEARNALIRERLAKERHDA